MLSWSYWAMPARHDKMGATLTQSNDTIISFNCDLSVTIIELTNGVFFICVDSLLGFYF